jgi:hypothetical protein
MKKIISLLILLLALSTTYSCNAFDWMDPNGNTFDRCKSLNDAGDFEGAIAACTDADPDGTNVEAQLELADAGLGAVGIDLDSLSEVFLKTGTGTITIVDLANSIITKGRLNDGNKSNAQNAVTAFDRYGSLLVQRENTLESKQVSVFYQMLARICQIAVLMAYSDVGATIPNGQVTREDVCNQNLPNCAVGSTTICQHAGEDCQGAGGLDDADAKIAADAMVGLVALLQTPAEEGGLPGNLDLKAIEDLVAITIPDPDNPGTNIAIQLVGAAYKADAGRRILLEIAGI